MNELSLFSGAGGGLLGTKLLGWRPIGYVEWEPYCQAVIAQRIKDGLLEEAPIFGDIREFVKSGAAREYRGFADVVTAGFPCQAFSTAARGRQRAEKDFWPETIATIEAARPRYVFLENPSKSAIKRASVDLRAEGYVVRCAEVSSAAVGAPHDRRRFWLFADSHGNREPDGTEYAEVENSCRFPRLAAWDDDPGIIRMDDGMASRMDRLKAIGNGQVPSVVVRAWQELSA